ncbi:MAG: hypothetical protein EON93_25755, partial [Burkholderiales bacterium]
MAANRITERLDQAVGHPVKLRNMGLGNLVAAIVQLLSDGHGQVALQVRKREGNAGRDKERQIIRAHAV